MVMERSLWTWLSCWWPNCLKNISFLRIHLKFFNKILKIKLKISFFLSLSLSLFLSFFFFLAIDLFGGNVHQLFLAISWSSLLFISTTYESLTWFVWGSKRLFRFLFFFFLFLVLEKQFFFLAKKKKNFLQSNTKAFIVVINFLNWEIIYLFAMIFCIFFWDAASR